MAGARGRDGGRTHHSRMGMAVIELARACGCAGRQARRAPSGRSHV